MIDSRKEAALAAIQAANPKWSPRHVRAVYEMMPSTNAMYWEKGSPERTYWELRHKHFWTKWAIEMNILPDDTPIPPLIDENYAPVATMNAVARAIANEARVTQNGVREPRSGTIARKIWDMSAALKDPSVDAAVAEGERLGLNIGNVKTEFSNWRKFNKNLGTK